VNRRRAILAAAATLLAAAALSPPATGADLEIAGGLSNASLLGSGVNGGSSRSGTSFLVEVRWPQGPRFSWRSGLGYVERGMVPGSETYLGPAGAGTVNETIELAYLEAPLLLGWSPPVHSRTHVTLFAGPAVAFKLSEWLHQTGVQEVKIKRADFQDEDVLGCVGANVEIPFPARYLFAEARVDAGLVDVLRPTAASGSARTFGMRLLLGYGWFGRH